jgi:hypothetical protein
MSFILDALRKSENSRLRQDHPAIFTTAITRQRTRLPRWVPVLVVLLVINLLFVGYALWRDRPVAERDASIPAPALTAMQAISPRSTTAETTTTEATTTEATTPAAPISQPAAAPAVAAARVVSLPPTPPTPASIAPPSVTRDDLLARGSSIPPAELNMHVFDPNPNVRFVLLNGQRLREGEASREGLTVERITPEGVVLRFGNSSFAVTLQ